MSIQVNPPPQIKIPPQLAKIPGFSALFNSLQRTITQLWLRTGGATDSIADGVLALELAVSNEIRVSANEADIEEIKEDLENIGVISETTTAVDYTTASNNLVRVTAPCTITLNLSPIIGERSLIQPQGNFLVTVIGNINNDTEVLMHNAYDLMDARYTASGWVIV